MKTKIAVLFAAFGYFFDVANAQCKQWTHDPELGMNATMANRTCTNVATNGFTANECQTDGWLCQIASPTEALATNCTDAQPFPWRENLPAGDTCTNSDQCFSASCVNSTETGRSTCAAKVAVNATCTVDIDCPAQYYCGTAPEENALTCIPAQGTGANCSAEIRCGFGHHCANHTCTKFGTLKDGDMYNLTDAELFPDITVETDLRFMVCENFFGVLTEEAPEGGARLLQCTEGYQREFEKDDRQQGDLDCKYSFKMPGTGQIQNLTLTAQCGFNRDTNYYCPARRGIKQFGTQNGLDRATWGDAPATCHHRSSIQYCEDIESNGIRSLAFRNFLRNFWITQGDNWSWVANNDRAVGNAIELTRNYWRLVDNSYSAAMSYLGLIAGFFALTFLF